jgi:hypothetical protein
LLFAESRGMQPREIARRSKLSAAVSSTSMQNCFPGRNWDVAPKRSQHLRDYVRIEPEPIAARRLKTGAE